MRYLLASAAYVNQILHLLVFCRPSRSISLAVLYRAPRGVRSKLFQFVGPSAPRGVRRKGGLCPDLHGTHSRSSGPFCLGSILPRFIRHLQATWIEACTVRRGAWPVKHRNRTRMNGGAALCEKTPPNSHPVTRFREPLSIAVAVAASSWVEGERRRR